MAIVVSNSVADELRRSATESAVHNVEAIVRGYVDPELQRVEPRPRRAARPGDRRAARAPDPVRRDPPDQHLVARRPDRLFERARAARPALLDRTADRRAPMPATAWLATSVATRPPTAAARAPATACRPCPATISSCSSRSAARSTAIRSASTTSTRTPASSSSGSMRPGPACSSWRSSHRACWSLLIWLAFGGASRVLAGQNRRLQEQATTERLLLVDLQRSEERFRSLVQNASDGVVVLGEDGLIRYESPAVERILGRRAEDGIGRPATADVHPDDRAIVDRRLADVARLERLGGRGRVPGPPRRRLVADPRGDRQEPARRPGRRRRGRQLPRHHRAEGARGAAPPPGVPRRPDRPGEPLAVPRPPRSRPGPGRPRRPADRGPVPRPRRLQGRQRPPRPRRGRPAARRRRRAAALGDAGR